MTISTDMLAAFVRVAEHLSVSRAAADLGASKSVVSKRVAQLESAVRATLFSRSTHKIALTPAGELYLEFARRALDEVSRAEERLRDLRSELSGLIRLTAPVSWGQIELTPRLPAFLAQHPGIELELVLSDRMMDLAYERIDLALRWSSVATLDHSVVPVAPIEWALVASPSYLVRAGTPRTPAELDGHPCMGYWRENADNVWRLVRGSRHETVPMRSRFRANTPDALAEAALCGLGIALLPGYLFRAALADGRLVRVLPEWTPETRFGASINAVAPTERMRLTRNRALVDWLQAQFATATAPAPAALRPAAGSAGPTRSAATRA